MRRTLLAGTAALALTLAPAPARADALGDIASAVTKAQDGDLEGLAWQLLGYFGIYGSAVRSYLRWGERYWDILFPDEPEVITVDTAAAHVDARLEDRKSRVGEALAGSFLVLSIVLTGVSLMHGGVALPSIIRMTGAAAGTLWVMREWADIVQGTLNGARGAIGLVIPGYAGPSSLFGMATGIAGRIELEALACGWTLSDCIGLAVLAAITGPIVWIGLAFTGLLATIAEFQLLVGAVAAPLILPALAFPLTAQLGWGAVYFLVKAGVRVVVMGVTSYVMAQALASTIDVPGTDGSLTSQGVFALVGLAVLTMMVGLYLNSIANDLVGGGEEIRLSFGDRRLRYGFSDFPGLRPRHVEAAGQAAAVFAGLEFGPHSPARPLLSVKVPPDLRATFTCPPAAERWHVALRFLRTRRLSLEDYVAQGVMTAAQAEQIRLLLRPPGGQARKNVVVSGGTGTGKTTLLRAMLGEIAAHERLVVLEDTPELAIPGDNVIHYHTTLNVDLAALLRHTLRSTPDRIVVGEVRGPEALELVRAMNTGHDGTLATLHSNGAEEAIHRLLTNVREAQPTFPERGVRAAVDAVVQLTGQGGARRVSDIWRVPR